MKNKLFEKQKKTTVTNIKIFSIALIPKSFTDRTRCTHVHMLYKNSVTNPSSK